jgi:hypothetical protein
MAIFKIRSPETTLTGASVEWRKFIGLILSTIIRPLFRVLRMRYTLGEGRIVTACAVDQCFQFGAGGLGGSCI